MFNINKFIECAEENVGENIYLKNVVKLNNNDPDPRDYVRSINSIDVMMSSNDFNN
jgi:hypothetical protein